MENNVKMVPAICTQCGGTVEVNKDEDTAKCPFCGASFIIEKAINNYNVKYATIEHADNVNIDVGDAVKDVLAFAGEQMKESREFRREERREAAKREEVINKSFLKIFGFVCAGMFAFAIIAFIVMQFTGGPEDTAAVSQEEESTISSYVENGCLYTDVLGKDILEWKYQEFDSMGTVLSYEDTDADGYHSCVYADSTITEGVRYVVTAAFDDSVSSTDPQYYSVVRVTISNGTIVDFTDPVVVYSLSEYNYE